MKHLPAVISAVLLAAGLSACVPARQHEALKDQYDKLKQTLETQEGVVTRLEKKNSDLQHRWNVARTELQNKKTELVELRGKYKDVQRKYKLASDELSETAANSLGLIEEKKQLNARIIKLQGTISTLEDRVKDLQSRLAEAKQTEPQPGGQLGPKNQWPKVPQ